MKKLRERLLRGTVTGRYPAETPPLFRGMPVLDPARCFGHATCTEVCPTAAIAVDDARAGGWRWRLDRARCVACGACADICPTGALSISREHELAARRREDLVTEVTFTTESAPPPPRAIASPPAADLGARLRSRVAALFRSSLHVRHLDVGSSNAEDWELNAVLNPLYDLQRFGIDFVASPRHADMLVVTGAVTRNLAPALYETYDATPEPRLVMALGADACSGGIAALSYATAGGVDKCIPVDVYVPGDPPRPTAIIHGFLLALERREQKIRGEHVTVPAPGPRGARQA